MIYVQRIFLNIWNREENKRNWNIYTSPPLVDAAACIPVRTPADIRSLTK